MLGIFVILTLVFASLTVGEYYQVNNLNSRLQSQSRTTVTTTVTCPLAMICAPFTYSPNHEVQIVSVEANKTDAAHPNVVFWVTFENRGSYSIQFDNYGLNFSAPANSSVLREVQTPGFAGGTDITGGYSISPGQSHTLVGAFPNTKSFYYQVVQPGTVDVNFNFTWRVGAGSTFSNTTTISAQFTFA
jgi:hypothetical protein